MVKIPAMLLSTFFLATLMATAQQRETAKSVAYLGFDRNAYPGDHNLRTLRKIFAYSGYWLNAPPGETATSWAGKRKALMRAGFGFLVLFNGRIDADIKAVPDAKALGESDGQVAVTAARRERFPPGTVIFLDQEEGGRLLPEQKTYLFAWVDAVRAAGFGAGVYCSGIPFKEGSGQVVVTAEDIHNNAAGRQITYWVANDACPPSPGCRSRNRPPPPRASGIRFARVWQFAQSPKRSTVASQCAATYSTDGNCYAPGFDPAQHMFVDLNSANSPDPSRGRGRR